MVRKKLFLDANILMEIMFARSKLEQIQEIMSSERNEFYISTLTVHLLYYFSELEHVDGDFVRNLVDLAAHLPITDAMCSDAQKRYLGKDFEDCLQAACAEQSGCDEIVTLDKQFEKVSSTTLPVRLIK